MRLTDRDLAFLRWMNGHYFVTAEQVRKRFFQEAKYTGYLYRRLKQMVDDEYLVYDRIFAKGDGVYRLTSKGVEVSQSEFPVVKKIALGTYHHDLAVVDVSLQLLNRYPDAEWIPERKLRQVLNQQVNKVGQRGHVPDGALKKNGESIAIEIETSTKGARRLKSIISQYIGGLGGVFRFSKVWYIVKDDATANVLLKVIEDSRMFQLYRLSNLEPIQPPRIQTESNAIPQKPRFRQF